MSGKAYSKGNCPCKGCKDRRPGCHAGCADRYIPWRKAIDAIGEKEREFHRSRDTMSEDAKRKIWRKARYRNQHHVPSGINEL